MKKLFVALSAAGLLMSACAQKEQYKVTGKIEGKTEGQVYLAKVQDNKLVNIDTATIAEGTFVFEGKVDSPDRYFIQFEGEKGNIQFFIENSPINVTGNIAKLNEVKIAGSSNHDVLIAFNELQKPYVEKNQAMYKDYQKAVSEKNQAAIDSIRDIAMKMEEEKGKKNEEFLTANPTKEATAFLASQILRGKEFAELEAVYNGFAENVKNSVYGKQIKEKMDIMKNTEIGMPAPDFNLNTNKDAKVSLSSLKGKVVVVDFWASWCGPCRAENPHMIELYNEIKDQGVEFLSVSVDKNHDKWLKAIEEDGLLWPQLIDDADVKAADKYGVQAIPFTVVVDKEGKIVAKRVFGAELKAAIEKVL